ncbi:MAG: AMP-binding protein [Hyphomicrobiales bacterium]
MMVDTIYEKFRDIAEAYPGRPFLNVIPTTAEAYKIESGKISYGALLARIEERKKSYAKKRYRQGHRIGLLLENRPVFFEHWFALNALGVSVVPINPDLRFGELTYLLGHSEQCLCVAIEERREDLRKACPGLSVIGPDDEPTTAPYVRVVEGDEAALLYTSGTTAQPKGCVLSNEYFLMCGEWYSSVDGFYSLSHKDERMLTPLPLFHMNAMACSVMGMIFVGGCLSVLDRFHPSSWWQDVRDARATIIHYLGVMPAILMNMPARANDKSHSVRFGFGAGVDRALHAPFEERFGFPLIEAWAMTETGNGAVVAAFEEPRHIGTNCFGKPREAVDLRVVNGEDINVTQGEEGELLVRHAGANPKKGFFTRYLKNKEATADSWAGGWFHTGDIVRENADGTLIFVDRKKNVIRRSGENISAVEVESTLNKHPSVASSAVAPVSDPLRGDEVFACIVARKKFKAEELVQWCRSQLAYYKAPGYVAFVNELPVTATNKLNRGKLTALVKELHSQGVATDMRHLKKRDRSQ